MLFKKFQMSLITNQIWVDNGSEFCNRSMESWLQNNDIEMYSTHNEGKNCCSERFIRTLKNEICKYITLISKIVYIDKIDYALNKYSNTYHRTIKVKPVDIKSSTYIEFMSWRYVISDLNGEETIRTVYEKRISKNKSKRVYS